MTSLSVSCNQQILSSVPMGGCLTLVVKKVRKRTKPENMAVFMCLEDDKEQLAEGLFEVVSLT